MGDAMRHHAARLRTSIFLALRARQRAKARQCCAKNNLLEWCGLCMSRHLSMDGAMRAAQRQKHRRARHLRRYLNGSASACGGRGRVATSLGGAWRGSGKRAKKAA
jgi:hypothetical protein